MTEPGAAGVTDTISRYGRFIDDRDWDGLASLLAETVEFDFTSLWGGAPETVTGPGLVARWRDMSERLDATQHLMWVIDGLSLRVAWVDGNQAVVTGAQ